MTELKVAPVAYAAAKYATENWHYSGAMPVGKLIRLGVWEDGKFVGVVIFGRGAAPQIGRPFGLTQTQVCELVRVALTEHVTPVTQVVAAAMKILRRTSPGLRLVVSYADPVQGHHGGIYQAGGWTYVGLTKPVAYFRDSTGTLLHSRIVSATGLKKQFGAQKVVKRYDECERVMVPGKHKYLYPLDRGMRRTITKLARPYPPRGPSVDGDMPGVLPGEPGSTPGDRS